MFAQAPRPIVGGERGHVVAIEDRLAASVGRGEGLEHEIGDELVDRLIVTTGRTAHRGDHGIAAVPAALLGR